MDDPAGTTGAKRIEVLKSAAARFSQVIPDQNGVGIVRFDEEAHGPTDPNWPGLAITKITSDADRTTVANSVAQHQTNAAGYTSVGDGIALARDLLKDPAIMSGYEQRAMIVFTDGLQNRPQSIQNVAGSIDDRTFAIGLGNETQVDTTALNEVTKGTGGYLLLTGILQPNTDDFFRVTKYFLQILAKVTNTDVVKDPNGFIAPGTLLRIPFELNEADIDSTVILLEDLPVIRLGLETPDGDIIDPGNAAGLGVTYVEGTDLVYYRHTLPLGIGAGAHAGTWHALLEVDRDRFKRYVKKSKDGDNSKTRAHGAQYSLVVHSFSNLRMDTSLNQSGYLPGDKLTVRAVLTEYGQPVAHRASVGGQLTRPDGSTAPLTLLETDPGVFEASVPGPIPGIYRFKVEAVGASWRGAGFTRESILTGAVIEDGGKTYPPPGADGDGWEDLVACLLDERSSLWPFLKERGLDPEEIMRCLERYRSQHPHSGEPR